MARELQLLQTNPGRYMINVQVGEIFARLQEAETVEERQKILADNDCKAVREIVDIALGVRPLTGIPDSEPPYKPSKVPYPHNDYRLHSAVRMFDNAFRIEVVRKERVEARFIAVLESLHADEAKLLVDAHLRRLDLKLTPEEIAVALPGFDPALVPQIDSAPEQAPEAEKKADQPEAGVENSQPDPATPEQSEAVEKKDEEEQNGEPPPPAEPAPAEPAPRVIKRRGPRKPKPEAQAAEKADS